MHIIFIYLIYSILHVDIIENISTGSSYNRMANNI